MARASWKVNLSLTSLYQMVPQSPWAVMPKAPSQCRKAGADSSPACLLHLHTTSRLAPASQECLLTVCTCVYNQEVWNNFTAWNNQMNHVCVLKEAIWKTQPMLYITTAPLSTFRHSCMLGHCLSP